MISVAPVDHNDVEANDFYRPLAGKNIFVTGGTGFFGRWVLESLMAADVRLGLGVSVTVLTRNVDAFLSNAPHLARSSVIKLCNGDVRNFKFPEGQFDYVIHAATDASAKLNRENPLEMYDTIVEGTRRTLEFAVRSGARKVLFTSSGAVYGRQPSDLTGIPEDYVGGGDCLDPLFAYGEGKRAAEMLCCLYAKRHGLEPKIARCFAFVGPHLPLDAHFAIGNFIRDALQGGPVVVEGDGSPYRSYLYAADLAVWLWKILLCAPPCRPYNVGSGDGRTIADIARCVARIGGVPVHILGKPRAGQPVARYVPDVSRAERELGLSVAVDVEESIRRTMAYYRKERAQ